MPKKFSELTEDIFEILSEVNDHDARELHLYADNHADLHRQRIHPVHKNLRNKMAAGTYDHEKAKKAFKHVTDDAAKRYKKEHGHHFDVATRKHVAGKMADEFHGEAKDGEHDHHLHKKYKGHKVKESVEQVDELDRSTVKSYQSKAAKDRGDRAMKIAQGLGVNFTDTNVDKKDYHKIRKRIKGMEKAKARTAEEVEQVDELDAKTLIRYNNAASQQVTRDTNTDTGKVTPKTTKRLKGALKARKKLDKIMPGLRGEEVEVEEGAGADALLKYAKQNPDKFTGKAKKDRSTHYRYVKGKMHRMDREGNLHPVKKNEEVEEEKKNKIKIKLDPKKKIGYEVKSIGPGGKSFVRKRRDMPGKPDIGESTEVMESFEFQFADKETAQEFMREISQKRLGSSTGTADGKVRTDGPAGAGVGSPTRAHQQMAKIMKKHGGKLLRTDEGPRMKRVFKEATVVDPITKKRVKTKPIKQKMGGPVTKDGKPFLPGKSKHRQKLGLESTELDELSAKTLRKYKDKARKDHSDTVEKGYDAKSGKLRSDFESRRLKRKAGFTKAMNKLIAKEDVEPVEEMSAKAHYKKYQNKFKVPPIDKSRYPNKEQQGLEGPYRSKKSGKIFYYDKKAGKYYDTDSDIYLSVDDVMESTEQVDEMMPHGINLSVGSLKDNPSMIAYREKVKKDHEARMKRLEKEREAKKKNEEVETKKENPMDRAKMLRRAMMRKMVKDIKGKRVEKAKAKETNETTATGQAVSGRRATPGTMSNTYNKNREADKRRGLTTKQSYQDAKAQRDRTRTDSNSGLSVKQNKIQSKASAAKGRDLERLHKAGYKTAFEETSLERRAEKEKVQAVAASKAAKADRNRRKARAALRTYRSEKRRADSLGEAKEMFTAVAIKNGKVVDQLRDLERKEFKDAAKYLKSTNKGAKISFENKSGKVVQTEGYDSKQALADVRKQTEKNQKARLKQDKAAKKFVQKHDCATHVEHVEFGEGQPINGQHAAPDEDGNIAWYDVMFEHGVEKNMSTDDLTILMSEMHENHDHEDDAIQETHLVRHSDGNYVSTTDGEKVKTVTYDKKHAKRFSKSVAKRIANQPIRKLGKDGKFTPTKRASGKVVREEGVLDEKMDPRDHAVERDGKFVVVDKDGKTVKTFDDKKEAEAYAVKNHDGLMGKSSE